jgi:type I restriction enzyme M protein
MLDDQTKARINSARDILVGKVPDPKSQVEQITIALIYKFMDDMDRQSEELGGKASFFSDGFKKYAWHKLIDPRLSGHERLMIYAEGLEKMNENKHIPQLFRDIFKGVFLPYRDPETLNLFLKQINEFTYDHSEQLGDAFEYLLSVLGSQGDAGQFRTPRHIIDFIVSIVDPKKSETVLDPACGTAGFLISAYKHILAANSKEGKGDLLTGDERGRLMDNFCGYDISPDMVRLSRANMYLHGFPQPRIHEYDTLTSEERWDERCDVIMANPPFMSPKGGIRPHNRFSIKATRSEVLFVDYIAEHLNVNGRAGVIVPEGIIFQAGNAYKTLRRMLAENYLWCVVSLPAGVFNPYSGVKTSILLMDKALAKRTDEILFVKIENDGFDLGAQRRVVEENDLPATLKAIVTWKNNREIHAGEIAHAVSRKRILESNDVSLSGDRLRPVAVRGNGKWPRMNLGELCVSILSGGTPSTSVAEYWQGSIPWITSADIVNLKTATPRRFITPEAIENSATNLIPSGSVIVVTRVGLGKLFQNSFDVCISQDSQGLVVDKSKALPDYLAFVLEGRVQEFKKTSQGSTIQGVTRGQLTSIEIPLPPLAEQERLVAELEGYRKIIEGAKQIIANYKPVLRVDPTWQAVPLEQVCSIKRGRFSHRPRNAPRFYGGPYPFMQTGDVVKSQGGPVFHTQTLNELGLSVSKLFNPPAVLITIAANIGDTGLLTYPACFPDSVVALTPNEQVKVEFLELAMRGQKEELSRLAPQAAQKNINVEILRRVEIPLPPIGTQREIVNELKIEGKLVEANRELIGRMEKKMQHKLAEIWGE